MSADAREDWRAVAAGWEQRRAVVWEASRQVSERLVELLDPRPGETVLELAAGPGDTGFLAAELLRPSGRLISSDLVPEMVDAARRRARELGVANADFLVLDGEAIELPDESVDGVLCRWGYMLMPDPARALAETRRVLTAGGRAAFAIWASADDNPWGSVVGRTLLVHGLVPPPAPDAPGPFRLADRSRVRALVADSGLELVVDEDVPVSWRYASFDDYWAVSRDLSRSLGLALAAASNVQAEAVRADVAAALEQYRTSAGYALPGLTRVVLARRP